jgi:hypothetical protein
LGELLAIAESTIWFFPSAKISKQLAKDLTANCERPSLSSTDAHLALYPLFVISSPGGAIHF